MIDVCFTPGEIQPGALEGRVAVVVDVLRATSTIVEALANGAHSVYPVSSIEAAVELAQKIGREDLLLCGERKGLPIDGFDLGNSPREYTPERVEGKTLIMTTTNGTPALLATTSAERALVASFLNLSAVVAELVGSGTPVTIIASGREKRFSLDDAVAAGALVSGIVGAREPNELGRGADSPDDGGEEAPAHLPDTAQAALILARQHLADLPSLFENTAAGRQLIDAGLGEDLAFCAQVDRHRIVPTFREGKVTL